MSTASATVPLRDVGGETSVSAAAGEHDARLARGAHGLGLLLGKGFQVPSGFEGQDVSGSVSATAFVDELQQPRVDGGSYEGAVLGAAVGMTGTIVAKFARTVVVPAAPKALEAA